MPATTYVSVPAALTKLLENSEQKPSEKVFFCPMDMKEDLKLATRVLA